MRQSFVPSGCPGFGAGTVGIFWLIGVVLRTLDYPPSGHWHWWALGLGAALFGGAWSWSLLSSLAMLKDSKSS
jgi:hypothetical protein